MQRMHIEVLTPRASLVESSAAWHVERMTHRTRLVSSLALAATTLAAAANLGCGGSDCTAACIANAKATGTLHLPDTAAHTYLVTYCVETTCRTFDLYVSGSQLTLTPVTTSGTVYAYGTVSRVDADDLTLELSLVNLTPVAGDAITVTVVETSTSTTQLSVTTSYPTVETVQVCSDTCEQASVDWDSI